ncbi:MMPL family transporter [Rubrobacter aplysinae]|uniref:MMPL family transporter n=1 Tax=Rubrobacter aplysinae TaxID=909625 RepID=UPI00069E8C95|nr:MMPL family transporter [Rubrobacter aplysinae]
MKVFAGLGHFTYRYRWAVVAVWAVIMIAGAFFAPNLADRLKGGGFDGAGTEAEQVRGALEEDFGFSPATLTVVFEGGENADARGEEFQRRAREALGGVRDMEESSSITTYASSGDERLVSEDGTDSYALVGFDASANETQDLVEEVRSRVESGNDGELETYVTGAPAVYLDIQEASNDDIRRAEAYAFPLALVILVVAFGSIVAAGVPVLVGGASVVTTLALLYFLSGTYDMSIFSLSIATMLGLGLGIDYALFAVSRFREELEEHEPAEAVPRTVATAGRSIFFSGTAVLIGLSGLLFFPFMFMRSIGVAGVTVVFVAVAAALTLLPAMLGILGHRVNALSIRRRRSFEATEAGFWGRSAEAVMRRPVIVIVAVGALLAALLYPVEHMKVGVPEASVLPQSYESRAGDDLLKQEFDYAALNPVQILAETPDDPLSADSLAATQKLAGRVGGLGGVESVDSIYAVGEEGAREYAREVSEARADAEEQAAQRVDEEVQNQLDEVESRLGTVPPGTEERIREEAESRAQEGIEGRVPDLPQGISNEGDGIQVTPQGVANFFDTEQARDSEEIQQALDTYVGGDRTLIQAVTESSPYDEQARQTVDEVRDVAAPAGTSFLVGGLSAGQADFISSLYGTAPYALAFVLGVTFLVLFFTFRSVFIPLKAVIVNMLSLTASFGAVVWVFQDGHLSGLLNFTPLGFVDSTLPILMFCTIFGVSMDYEVFLLSRMREAYESGEPNSVSVRKGLVSTAGIITSAAAILVVVTGAFAFAEIIITKAIGLGLAVAILVDATIIRIMLVPALMRILGDWNWWPGGRKKIFHGAKHDPEE